MRALVRTATSISSGDASVAADAVDAVDALPGLAACADAAALMQATPLPDDPAARARIDALETRLDDGFAKKYLGRYEEALAIGEPLLVEARAAGHPPLLAESLALLSGVYHWLDRTDDAIRTLWEMYAVGAASRDDHAMADAIVALLNTLGDPDDKRFPQAVALVPVAEGLAVRAGDEELLAKMWLNTGIVVDIDGNAEDDAARRYQNALALRAKLHGPDSFEVARVLNSLGSLESERGNYDTALAHLERALRLKRAELGDTHHQIVSGLYNLGVTYENAGRHGPALPKYDEALEIARRLPTPDPSFVARLHLARSDALVALDRHDEALAAARAATDILEGDGGGGDANVALRAMAVFAVGHVHHVRGELAPAIAEYRRAVAMIEASLGADSLHVYNPVYQLAKALCASGQTREGTAFAERALAVGKRFSAGAEANARTAIETCRTGRPP
jgi:serine/threonine-protein kinase